MATKYIIIPEEAALEIKANLIYFNLCSNDQQRAEVVHHLYDRGYHEIAEALSGFITGQSINFQAYYDSITTDQSDIQTRRAISETRKNKWTIGNIFRFGQKLKAEISKTIRKA